MPNDFPNKEKASDVIIESADSTNNTHIEFEFPRDLAAKYEKLAIAGSGGMATVIKARHRITGQIVAIKLLHQQTQVNLKRFKQEASTISKLAHPNIVTIHDFGIEDDTAYLITEYVDGQSLAAMSARKQSLDEPTLRRVFSQVCEGLEHAHRNGVVHRDMKPGNILIFERDGQPVAKIADFGIAKITVGDTGQNLTQTGEVIGTPLYMSPEQSMGHPATASSDIYSLGCVMYEMLAFQPPIVGENFLDTVHRRVHGNPKTLTQLGVKVTRPLEQIVMRCLEKDPHQRAQSAAELKAELDGSASHSSPVAVGTRSSGLKVPMVLAITIALFVVLGVLVGNMMADKGKEQGPAPRIQQPTATSPGPLPIEGVDKLQFSAVIESDAAGRVDKSHIFYNEGAMTADAYQQLNDTALVKSLANRWKAYYGTIFDAIAPEGTKPIPHDVRSKINVTVSPGKKLVASVEWQDPTDDPKSKQFTANLIRKIKSLNNSEILQFPAKSDGISFSVYAGGSDNSLHLDSDSHGLISQ